MDLSNRPTDHAKITEAMAAIFPDANLFEVHVYERTTEITICADERGVKLTFADMPKIADALGTERLNFTAMAGSDVVDSYTFDGCVLYIVAKYAGLWRDGEGE